MKPPIVALAMLATYALCAALLLDAVFTVVAVACVGVALVEMRGKR